MKIYEISHEPKRQNSLLKKRGSQALRLKKLR